MGIKKKLGLSMASAALGLSLVGGGTYAYFSDEAKIHNAFAAGTLNLEVGNYPNTNWPLNFDLSNIRPGDSFERQFVLKNTGSLAIENTFMSFINASVTNPLNTGATQDDFLSALKVTYFVDATSPVVDPNSSSPGYLLLNSQDITLKEAIDGQFSGKIKPQYLTADGKLNLTPLGIDAGDSNRFRIVVSFPDTGQPQNKLQGMQAKVDFNLDARQVIGNKNHNQQGPNGEVTGNGKQGLTNKDTDSTKTTVNPSVTDDAAWND
jgi:spore coat-associated protein N